MGVFAGTGRLLRLALRRDRIKLPVWILLIVGFMGSMIPALKEAYGAVTEQAAYQQLLETSAIGRLFAGAPTEVSFGAVVTGESAQRAMMLGLDAARSLSRNDAYPFFEALGDLLKPGPTGTNVNDLSFLIAF